MEVYIKSTVVKSTLEHVRDIHRENEWIKIKDNLSPDDVIKITSGGNVPLSVMGRFNAILARGICENDRNCITKVFKDLGRRSAEEMLTGNGIFSIFARFSSLKQVLKRAGTVIKTAYPGCEVEVILNSTEDGGTIKIMGMDGYPYGILRILGWLERGIEIVGGKNP